MSLPDLAELAGLQAAQAMLDPPTVRLRQDRVAVRKGHDRLDQQGSIGLAAAADPVGPGEVAKDRGGQLLERPLQGPTRVGPSSNRSGGASLTLAPDPHASGG